MDYMSPKEEEEFSKFVGLFFLITSAWVGIHVAIGFMLVTLFHVPSDVAVVIMGISAVGITWVILFSMIQALIWIVKSVIEDWKKNTDGGLQG